MIYIKWQDFLDRQYKKNLLHTNLYSEQFWWLWICIIMRLNYLVLFNSKKSAISLSQICEYSRQLEPRKCAKYTKQIDKKAGHCALTRFWELWPNIRLNSKILTRKKWNCNDKRFWWTIVTNFSLPIQIVHSYEWKRK